MNAGTILTLLVLALILGLAIRSLVRDKKAGKSTCGNNCAHCAAAGTCHGTRTE